MPSLEKPPLTPSDLASSHLVLPGNPVECISPLHLHTHVRVHQQCLHMAAHMTVMRCMLTLVIGAALQQSASRVMYSDGIHEHINDREWVTT